MVRYMRNTAMRGVPRYLTLLAVAAWATMPTAGQTGAKTGEWRYYGSDAGSTKYSPLDQISKDNVKDLRIVWRWHAENFGPRPDYNLQATPLMVGGVLYTTAGSRRNVVAIDGATGETLWTFRFDEGQRGERAARHQHRGVAYWTDATQERILYITPGYQLIALDAKSGRPISSFGRNGVVDLYEGLDRPDPKPGTLGSSSPPIVVKDVVVVGTAGLASVPTKENTAAPVRGYDVRTGKPMWIFHTIPRPGEFGHETWENDSWSYTGNTGVWAPMSADEDLGYVYLPVETPTNDFYGGDRLGDNVFANSGTVSRQMKSGKDQAQVRSGSRAALRDWQASCSVSSVRADTRFGARRLPKDAAYSAAVIESTWIVLVLASSVPTTLTFRPANFFGVCWSLSV